MMPRVDFSAVKQAGDHPLLPPGVYEVEVDEIDVRRTRRGDEFWRARLVVLSGEHEGRFVFDHLVFAGVGLKRVKLACACLGLDVDGEVDLTPQMLVGRSCRAQVDIEEYEDRGGTRRRNKLPFAGYMPVEEEEKEENPF